MAVLEAHEAHQNLVDELLEEVTAYNPEVDRELLARAFRFAAAAHEGQQRRSGEAFIHHPWGVAKICAQLRLDEQTIAAALLHDVVEDTGAELDEVRAEFGEEIARLVDGVTKLTRVQFQSREQAEAENYRKMVVAMAEDERVILIKLADRLHNLRQIEYLGKQKQLQKARETLEVYAPLAHRLGIHALKWELEDLAFATLHPRKYDEIKTMVAERRADREEHVREAGVVLQAEPDARDRRARDGRALALQGQARPPPRPGVDGLGEAAHGHDAGRRGRPAGVHEDVPDGRLRRRGLRLHAEGRGEDASGRGDADRLRLRRAHGRRPPHRRRQGERPHRPAPLPRAVGRHRRDPHLEVGPRTVARLALARRLVAGAEQDPPVVLARDA